jgi:flagellar biosynthesis/type III secretory pathway M-ring protein FliF/YscJ
MSMVLKPMVKRIITPSEYERAKAALAARMNSGDLNRLNDPGDININTMVQSEGQPQTMQTANGGTTVISDMGLQHASATQQMIARAQVTGEVHQQTITHIGELVDRNPKETAAILRKWMSEAA